MARVSMSRYSPICDRRRGPSVLDVGAIGLASHAAAIAHPRIKIVLIIASEELPTGSGPIPSCGEAERFHEAFACRDGFRSASVVNLMKRAARRAPWPVTAAVGSVAAQRGCAAVVRRALLAPTEQTAAAA